MKFLRLSKFGKPWLRIHVGKRSRSLGMTMWRIICSIFVKNVTSKCSIRFPTHHNKMVLQSTKLGLSRRWKIACWKQIIWILRYGMNPLTMFHTSKIEILTNIWMEKHHMGLEWVTSQVFLILGSLVQRLGLGFFQRRERPCSLKERSPLWLDMFNMKRVTISLFPHILIPSLKGVCNSKKNSWRRSNLLKGNAHILHSKMM